MKTLPQNKQSFRVLNNKINILPQQWPCLSRGHPKWMFTVLINASHLNRGWRVNVDTLSVPLSVRRSRYFGIYFGPKLEF